MDYLEKTAELMWQRYGAELSETKVHFDLSELHGYHYKTGVVFAAFVPQLGQAIARGGRYDDIGEIFGRARAATGFSTDLKVLNQLSTKQFATPEKIFAPAEAEQNTITALRAEGKIIVQQLPGQQAGVEAMGCNKSLCLVWPVDRKRLKLFSANERE
jgi:ATP phosphoribosyltransferase regulatory subunit